ncbi:MAG: AAA domain-containing protein [Anaerolineaceae bacterium]
MKISDVYSAKGLKVKLNYIDSSAHFSTGLLIHIEATQRDCEFLVNQYGAGIGITASQMVLCKADRMTAEYILDLINGERNDAFRCMFAIEGVNDTSLEIQAYTFRSVTEYKTSIYIKVPEKLLEKTNLENLYKEYVWDQLGEPALFCLNYKNNKKQNEDIRFFSGKRYLIAHNTPRGIIAESERYLKERYEVPVDVYIAPEIKFVSENETSYMNDGLAADLDKISNPASYFTRWDAYNKLSKRLLEQESEEFGELHYSSYTKKTDLSGTTYEFVVNEELDESFKGKELGASQKTAKEDNAERTKQTVVGQIKKISGKKVTTYIEAMDGLVTIPDSGSLTLYTAGDRYIMARRDAARDRMVKHQSPIKSIVALIEAGASEYELPSNWGSEKAVTEELKKNFPKASDLNPEQIEALSTAINTPDIALIQGPPGTGKTTVIKAICERFREIYEAEERQKKKLNPEHVLRSPKILISSFQNEAVDNAISTPLPGDIPAYRKTAKRTKDSTKEQYQKALDGWYASVYESINKLIEDKATTEFVENRKRLNDEFISYKNAGEPLELAAKLIKQYLSYTDICYPQELIDAANAVIRATAQDMDADDIPDPIIAKLEAQRTWPEAFSDDGEINARRLSAHLKIRDDLEIDERIIDAIDAVCNKEYSEAEFARYVDTVKRLQKQYCKHGVVIDIQDKSVVHECIVAMSKCFANQYINTLSDIESKKSLILSEFLSRLEQEYETIVRKYSMTTAATCQTSLDLRENTQKTFDLVVIDEAARANPLDLFIPMSMGKKIVLVGDHKQLPHMLEQDVLKVIMDDPRFKDLPEMEKSLFERLFGMFLKGQKKAVLLTHQFRMHPEICKFVSEAFYDGQLQTAESVTPELRSSPKSINSGRALTLVNVPISRGAETPGISKSRRAEVEAISKDVKTILETDREAKVGIITFYAAQTMKIKRSLDMLLDGEEISRVEVGTVDAFQGKEFDYVLLSCVRSNKPRGIGEQPKVGFLEKPNRLCVAFSRARRQLITYGDVETLIQIPCFSRLYDICAKEGGGCYREY